MSKNSSKNFNQSSASVRVSGGMLNPTLHNVDCAYLGTRKQSGLIALEWSASNQHSGNGVDPLTLKFFQSLRATNTFLLKPPATNLFQNLSFRDSVHLVECKIDDPTQRIIIAASNDIHIGKKAMYSQPIQSPTSVQLFEDAIKSKDVSRIKKACNDIEKCVLSKNHDPLQYINPLEELALNSTDASLRKKSVEIMREIVRHTNAPKALHELQDALVKPLENVLLSEDTEPVFDLALDTVEAILDKTHKLGEYQRVLFGFDANPHIGYFDGDPVGNQDIINERNERANALIQKYFDDHSISPSTPKSAEPIATLKNASVVMDETSKPIKGADGLTTMFGKVFYVPDPTLSKEFENKQITLVTPTPIEDITDAHAVGRALEFDEIKISSVQHFDSGDVITAETDDTGHIPC